MGVLSEVVEGVLQNLIFLHHVVDFLASQLQLLFEGEIFGVQNIDLIVVRRLQGLLREVIDLAQFQSLVLKFLGLQLLNIQNLVSESINFGLELFDFVFLLATVDEGVVQFFVSEFEVFYWRKKDVFKGQKTNVEDIQTHTQ